jgi:hypothetical protein
MHWVILDPTPTTHSVKRPSPDSPPSPSPPHNDTVPISSPLQTITSLANVSSSRDPQRTDFSPTHHPPPPLLPGNLSPSRACSLAFLPVGSSVDSVDWPPIESTLQPSGKNAEQDSDFGILVSETSSSQRDMLTNRFLATQKPQRLPLQDADNMPSTSVTSRNPLPLPLPQVIFNRKLTEERP